MFNMVNGIELLLLAATLLERREKDSDHGYACPARPYSKSFSSSRDFPGVHRRRKLKRTRSVSGSSFQRSSHNELEKNRRAHMRHCFEQLKKVVPLDGSSSRHTTQGLLICARQRIKKLEAEFVGSKTLLRKESVMLEALNEKLAQLKVLERSRSRYGSRSYSESSSSVSISPTSETDHVDVVGLSSTPTPDDSLHYCHLVNNECTTTRGRPGSSFAQSGSRLLTAPVYVTMSRHGHRARMSSNSSPSDLDDSSSLDSGCGLSPVDSKMAIDSL